MKKVILKKRTFKKATLSILIIISLILILMLLETINTASYNSDSQSAQVLTILDADPNAEDEELIAEAIKLSITPMNMNSNEYITNGID